MKRRNFLSGLLAAPLALKARLARFFGQKPVELFYGQSARDLLQITPRQLLVVQLLAEGKSMREVAAILWPRSMEQWAEKQVTRSNTFKGPRISLN